MFDKLERGLFKRFLRNEVDESIIDSFDFPLSKALLLKIIYHSMQGQFTKANTAIDMFFGLEDEPPSPEYLFALAFKIDVTLRGGSKPKVYNQLLLLEELINTKSDELHPMEKSFLLALLNKAYGLYYFIAGMYSEGIKHYKIAISAFESIGDKAWVFLCYDNIGYFLMTKGDYKSALEYLTPAKEYFEKESYLNYLASVLENSASCYWKIGMKDLAIQDFEKSISLLTELENAYYLGWAYSSYIEFLINSEEFEKAELQLKKFNDLAIKFKDPSTITRYNYTRALLLKEQKDLFKILEAHQILVDLIEDDRTIFQYQVKASFAKAEILLLNYILFQTQESISQIIDTANNLYRSSINYNSYDFAIQALILKSKVNLIDGSFKDAIQSVNEANKIANKNNIAYLRPIIENQLELLSSQDKDYSNIKFEIGTLQINQAFDFVRLFVHPDQLFTEKPIFVILVDAGGSVIFDLQYSQSPIGRDTDKLIGNFIRAFNDFGREIFKNEQHLKLIQHGEFTIISKQLFFTTENKKGTDFLFIYVFRGNLIAANLSLNRIVNQTLKLNVLSPLTKSGIHDLKPIRSELQKIVQQIIPKP